MQGGDICGLKDKCYRDINIDLRFKVIPADVPVCLRVVGYCRADGKVYVGCIAETMSPLAGGDQDRAAHTGRRPRLRAALHRAFQTSRNALLLKNKSNSANLSE